MKKYRKYRDLIAGLIAGIVLTACIPVVFAGSDTLSQVIPFSRDSLWLLKQARVIIESYQVDASKNDVPENEMVYGAMRGMFKAWKDPYTRFLDPQQLEEEKQSFEGSFGGVGITIASRDGKTLVMSPIEGTPGDKAGLRPQDEIVRINDDIVIGWTLDKVVKQLRGDAGTSVSLGIRREGVNYLLDFDIVRDNIKIETVSHEMLPNKIGYIRLRQFIRTSAADVGKAVTDLKSRGAEGLILDLRNNGGGLIDAARDICDLFIDGGLVVSTKGRVKSSDEEYYVNEGVLSDLPMVLLINEGSASASEIVSGAMRDRNNTLLIGAKSFGKGSVQVLFNLSDGSGMFVTTARYYTPAGVKIDHVGLVPDIKVESVWKQPEKKKDNSVKKEISGAETDTTKIEKAESDSDSSLKKKKSVLDHNDPQLEKARETVKSLIEGVPASELKDPPEKEKKSEAEIVAEMIEQGKVDKVAPEKDAEKDLAERDSK